MTENQERPVCNLDIKFEMDGLELSFNFINYQSFRERVLMYAGIIKFTDEMLEREMHVTSDGVLRKGNIPSLPRLGAVLDIEHNLDYLLNLQHKHQGAGRYVPDFLPHMHVYTYGVSTLSYNEPSRSLKVEDGLLRFLELEGQANREKSSIAKLGDFI